MKNEHLFWELVTLGEVELEEWEEVKGLGMDDSALDGNVAWLCAVAF